MTLHNIKPGNISVAQIIPWIIETDSSTVTLSLTDSATEQTIFSSSLYTHAGSLEFDPYDIITQYMRNNSRAFLTVRVSAGDGQTDQSVEMAFLHHYDKYPDRPIPLLDSRTILRPRDSQDPITICFFSESDFYIDIEDVRPTERIPVRSTLMNAGSSPNTHIFEVTFDLEDMISPDTKRLDISANGEVISIYLTDRQPSASFTYRNSFLCAETFHSFGTVRRSDKTQWQTAISSRSRTGYSQEREQEITITSHNLQHNQVNALCVLSVMSPGIDLTIHDGHESMQTEAIVMNSDIVFESDPGSDPPQLVLKVIPRFTDHRARMTQISKRIFTPEFRTQFR